MSAKGDVEDTKKDLSDSVAYASIRSSMVMRRQSSMMAIRPWCWCRQSCRSSRRLGRSVGINGHGLGGPARFPVTDPKNLLTNSAVAQLQRLGGWRKQPGWHRTLLPFFSASLRACHPQWQTNRGQRPLRIIPSETALMPFALRSVRSAQTGRSRALQTRLVNLTKKV